MRRVIAGLAVLALGSPLTAQEPAEAQAERQHEVRRGETLWELARSYLDDPFQWPTIFRANTTLLNDPDLIYPGQRLVIPRPGARVAEAGPGAVEEQPIGTEVDEGAPGAPGVGAPARAAGEPDPVNRTVFYRPPSRSEQAREGPTVLREPGIEVLPVKPGEFRAAPYLADPTALPTVARLIRSLRADPEDWGRIEETAHPRDDLLFELVAATAPEVGTEMMLVEVGEPIQGAALSKRLIIPRGLVRVDVVSGGTLEGHLAAQYGPAYPGALLLPMEPMPEFTAETANAVSGGYDLQGTILDFVEDRPLYFRADLAFIDLGAGDGVSVGDVFQAVLPPREAVMDVAEDQTLPAEPVADLRVVRVTEDVATVKVDALTLARLRAGLPVRRIRKMP